MLAGCSSLAVLVLREAILVLATVWLRSLGVWMTAAWKVAG